MDRIDFDLHDKAYQESKQKLTDATLEEIKPEFDKQLATANENHIQRLWYIRNSNYTFADRQRIEQEELLTHQNKVSDIEAKKQEELNTSIAPLDQTLQKMYFGDEGRDVVEQALMQQEQEQAKLDQYKPDEEAEIATEFNTASKDHFDIEDFEYSEINEEYDSLSDEFSEISTEPIRETPDAGIEM